MDCGQRYGKGIKSIRVSTWSQGTCDLCGQTVWLTEPRDFGHLVPNWQKMYAEDQKQSEG